MQTIPYTPERIFSAIGVYPGNYPTLQATLKADFEAILDAEGLDQLTNGTNDTGAFRIDRYEIAGWCPTNSAVPVIVVGWLTISIPLNPDDPAGSRDSFTITWLHDVKFTDDSYTMEHPDVLRVVLVKSFASVVGMESTQQAICGHLADRDIALEATTGLWSRIKRALG